MNTTSPQLRNQHSQTDLFINCKNNNRILYLLLGFNLLSPHGFLPQLADISSLPCFTYDTSRSRIWETYAELCQVKLVEPHLTARYTRQWAIDKNLIKESRNLIPKSWQFISIPVGAFALGTWQVQRRKWKLDLIDTLKKRTSAEPIDLPADLDELKDKEFCQLKAKGKFLYEKEFLIGPRSLIKDGEAISEKGGGLISGKSYTGYYVITPFKLEDRDMTIMVNRGWIPRKERATFKEGNTVTDSIEIVGVLRMTEKRPPFVPNNAPAKGVWHYRDLDAMAKESEAEPVYIELLARYSTPHGPIGGQTRVNLRNEHLSYIFTWYALSTCTGYMWYRYFVRKLPLL
ncbi:Surfeit locus protein [Ooceraea biroi]|uniref:SURF1-like protein n=1 Tax=Ooceraea biroi TaxID=2015173 RepID=A0A026W6D6_OOCBI|nr:Surfeit locus protein [Ooceraea biroi]